MLRKIESLRKQPKNIRNRYAFWIALFATSIVFMFWVLSVPSRFDNTFAEENQRKESDESFFDNLKDLGSYAAVKFGEIGSKFETISELTSSSTQNGEVAPEDVIQFFATSTDNDEHSGSPQAGQIILIATTTPTSTGASE